MLKLVLLSNQRGRLEQSTMSNALGDPIFWCTKIGINMNDLLEATRAPLTTSSGADLSIKKILVAVDLSRHSERTAAYATELAAPFGASLTLVHVSSPKEAAEVTNSKDSRFGDPVIAPELDLENLARKVRETYPTCSAYLCAGDPADKIVRMAETLHADLIVDWQSLREVFSRAFGTGSTITDRPSRPLSGVSVSRQRLGEEGPRAEDAKAQQFK
jgi:nucleotide-binding universal stress UspA family protein